ncbi:MAG: MaoC domain protein dehydratase [Rhodoglobus sp.]|nr:MaoC domain protein dehydratase [Rhodoglobus sp.]
MTQERVNVDFDVDRVGVWSPDSTATLSRDSIAAYAAATGETDPRALAGDLSTLLFGVVPSWHLVADVISSAVPEEHRHRAVHGEHLIESSRPLRPGDELRTRAAVSAIRPTSTGTIVIADVESTDPSGLLVIRQRSTAFYVGVLSSRAAGEAGPRREPDVAGGTEIRIPTDSGLPLRYALASGDMSPIHLEDAAARAIGLPGVILHGMCSLALAGRAVVQVSGADFTGLRSLSCRFSGVARPGDDLVVGVGDSAFSASSPAGAPVLTGGRFTMEDTR